MKKETIEAQKAERQAAHMLLVDYIENHANEIALRIEKIIPFFQECNLHGLQSAMNTVNVTFASVALKVVETQAEWDDIDDPNRQFLPVDAVQMRHAIYYLSKFISLFGPFSKMCESNDPAINMCKQAFSELEHF